MTSNKSDGISGPVGRPKIVNSAKILTRFYFHDKHDRKSNVRFAVILGMATADPAPPWKRISTSFLAMFG